jgi:hypothetical protein
MGIVRFALRFPYTFYVLAALGSVDEISTDDVFAIPLRNRA